MTDLNSPIVDQVLQAWLNRLAEQTETKLDERLLERMRALLAQGKIGDVNEIKAALDQLEMPQ